MGEDTFKKLQGDNKELLIVENATHTDLYDGGEHHYIPFDKINAFFNQYLVDKKYEKTKLLGLVLFVFTTTFIERGVW